MIADPIRDRPSRRRSLAALLILGAVLLGCGSGAEERPNVLLITLDTTRTDRLGSYGYAGGTSPRLDALAADGVRFEYAVSQASVTPVAHASILTGLNPYSHGLRVFYGPVGHTLESRHPTLAGILGDAGWQTGAFVSSLPASERFGLDHGFDTFRSGVEPEVLAGDPARRTPKDGKWLRVATGVAQRRADPTTDEALAWIAEADRPWFAWVHYFDPHDPSLIPPEPFTERFDLPPTGSRKMFDAYDSEIYFVDHHIGRLFDALSEAGVYDDTIIVVTADHGQGMGDHDWLQHRLLYREQIHIPLLIRYPGGPRGQVVGSLARGIDILPTVLDLAGLGVPEIEGKSLVPSIAGTDDPPRIGYAEALNTLDMHAPPQLPEHQRDLLFAAMDRDWKLIYHHNTPENSELYHLASDPMEATDVSQEYPDQVERLLEWLRESGAMEIETVEPAAPMDAEMRHQLEALGYGK